MWCTLDNVVLCRSEEHNITELDNYSRLCSQTIAINELGTAPSSAAQPLSSKETEQQVRAAPRLELRRGLHKSLPAYVSHDLTGKQPIEAVFATTAARLCSYSRSSGIASRRPVSHEV